MARSRRASVGVHGQALRRAGFVDDALEKTANRGIGERALIVVFGILQNFLFAIRLVERQMLFLFEFADFQRTPGTLVEKLDQFAVKFVDAAAEVGQRSHLVASLANRTEIPRSARNDDS